MITTFYATTKPRMVSAIFFDGINYEKVLEWIRNHNRRCCYKSDTKEIILKDFLEPAIILRAGYVLVLDEQMKVLKENVFKNEYNVESEICLK